MTHETDPFIPRGEAAKRLGGLHRDTMLRWEKAGLLPPPIRLSSRKVGYRVSDIERVLNERRGALQP